MFSEFQGNFSRTFPSLWLFYFYPRHRVEGAQPSSNLGLAAPGSGGVRGLGKAGGEVCWGFNPPFHSTQHFLGLSPLGEPGCASPARSPGSPDPFPTQPAILVPT